jgi:2-amino-4-hydroxy-6-hydroxymethyldihydropteridine diphosphokinase
VNILSPLLSNPLASHVYETAPIGGPEQPEYANAVLIGLTDAAPEDLLAAAHQAEQEWHRVREVRWGPRTLDVDVLDVEDVVRSEPTLILPHPRICERGFVLVPWLEIEPDAVLANGVRLGDQSDVLERARRDGLVRQRVDVALVVEK